MSSFLADLLSSLGPELNSEQQAAAKLLASEENVFVTGGAGTGKSFLLRSFLRGADSEKLPVLASTGAAAVLIGGRTFHSFFGLGIMEGGAEATVERALKNRRVTRRLQKIKGFVLDEVSMIPGQALDTAEKIASLARNDPRPWGGLQVITVGDFAQLPPISRYSKRRDWAFLSTSWQKSNFHAIQLSEMMRSREDLEFCEILNDVRQGLLTERVRNLLDWRTVHPSDDSFEATVLYARKNDVDRINQFKLAQLDGESHSFATEYVGDERSRKALAVQAPIPEVLEIKKDAFVMIRQNDPRGRWVNGSLGHVKDISENELEIRLLNKDYICLERASFSMLDAEGKEVAAARNFPLNLAYAVTIHKAQGATLDRVLVSLRRLWEPGQAYVALSRVRSSDNLMIDGWDPSSIIADPAVKAFHDTIVARTS